MSHSVQEDWDFDNIPLPLHSMKNILPVFSAVIIQWLHFPRWSLSGIFSDSLGISRFPPCIAHHALPVMWHILILFLASVPLTLKSKTSFFSLCLCFPSTLSWISHGFSRSSSSKMELLLLLPKMPSLPHCSTTSIRFHLSHFILFTLRLPLILFA